GFARLHAHEVGTWTERQNRRLQVARPRILELGAAVALGVRHPRRGDGCGHDAAGLQEVREPPVGGPFAPKRSRPPASVSAHNAAIKALVGISARPLASKALLMSTSSSTP